MTVLAAAQQASDPPATLRALNDTLVTMLDEWGTALKAAAAIVGKTANPMLAEALPRVLEESLVGGDHDARAAGGLINSFIRRCG